MDGVDHLCDALAKQAASCRRAEVARIAEALYVAMCDGIHANGSPDLSCPPFHGETGAVSAFAYAEAFVAERERREVQP